MDLGPAPISAEQIEALLDVTMLFWPNWCADPANAGALASLRAGYAELLLQNRASELVAASLYRRTGVDR